MHSNCLDEFYGMANSVELLLCKTKDSLQKEGGERAVLIVDSPVVLHNKLMFQRLHDVNDHLQSAGTI